MSKLFVIAFLFFNLQLLHSQYGMVICKHKTNNRTVGVVENKRIVICDKNGTYYRGRFTIANDSTLIINNDVIRKEDIESILLRNKVAIVIFTGSLLIFSGSLLSSNLIFNSGSSTIADLYLGLFLRSVVVYPAGIIMLASAPFLFRTNYYCYKWDYIFVN